MIKPTILILGALSDIGMALARAYAGQGYNLLLAARDAKRLETDVADLMHRGAPQVRAVEWDVLAMGQQRVFIDGLGLLPDVVVCVVGMLGDQKQAERDMVLADKILRTNYLGPSLILGDFANRMEARGSGLIIGISSVAGDRGRASNYLYGSAKAGFTAFLSGLRNRLVRQGVHVLTVKPGFVATRMTAGMKLPKALTAEPVEVAQAILHAVEKHKDVVYIYPIWRIIMLIIRHIPEAIFKRLKL